VDTVSADKKNDEVETDNRTERHHSSVRLDAVVHDVVPVLTRQYLNEVEHHCRHYQLSAQCMTRLKYICNPLEFRGNYSATSNNMKLVHWPLMGGLLHLVQHSDEGTGL